MSRWWVFLCLAIPIKFLWADEITVQIIRIWLDSIWYVGEGLLIHWWLCRINGEKQ